MSINGLRKVLIIGSGPIIIGQGAEFDYAGSQACRALREDGLEIVLANSNPATIMTEGDMADRTYFEPLTFEFLARLIDLERPEGLLPTMGGQVGLNLALELAKKGILDAYGVKLMGTPLAAIEQCEDRKLFKACMEAIGEPVLESFIANTVEEAASYGREIGYPVIIRPAYTLGGTGGGIAGNEQEVRAIAFRGLKASLVGQVLVERSVVGWKEIEYEVIRDGRDNCLAVCSMENIDPVGIHTGDSIVVAPVQTLTDVEHQRLRTAALKIIRALKIAGGCNVQFALDPAGESYYVIEVNPRVSRSSALASKATGYPIARIAAKIALGYPLDAIPNKITGTTSCFEPALDYVVVKIPRFPFDKLGGERVLGTQMKATGEVMAIDRTFERALLKGLHGLEFRLSGKNVEAIKTADAEELEAGLQKATDLRIFYIFEAFRREMALAEVARLTRIDLFFLQKIQSIITMEKELRQAKGSHVDKYLLQKAKKAGFSDTWLADIWGITTRQIWQYRKEHGVMPVYKMVDTCAAEFSALTPYYYSAYDAQDEVQKENGGNIVVLGSGPIRIGQGIEFDCGSVECIQTIRKMGLTAVAVNNNPETVSTDFDIADRLYFEPLTTEDVMHILEREQPEGVIVQFGGQTALNLAKDLAELGAPILGTSIAAIDQAEDREKFEALLTFLNIPQPPGSGATAIPEALQIAEALGYPVMVRPSYVIGGRGMEIVYNQQELLSYLSEALELSQSSPVLIDKYFIGTEVEVDAVSDGDEVLIPGIMQHVERTGVHSGDSIAVYPAFSLTDSMTGKIIDYTRSLARALGIKGLFNIQFIIREDEVYVLEVNPRSSRTVPFLSKVTGIPLTQLATKMILGEKLSAQEYGRGLLDKPDYSAVKVPVFSLSKLTRTDISLGPEMKSTGEVMGLDHNLTAALYKGLVAAGLNLPAQGNILAAFAERDKREAAPLLIEFAKFGYNIYATSGTAAALKEKGVPVEDILATGRQEEDVLQLVKDKFFDLVFNTFTRGKDANRLGFKIRRTAVESGITCLTSLDTVRIVAKILAVKNKGDHKITVKPIQDYKTPGLILTADNNKAKIVVAK